MEMKKNAFTRFNFSNFWHQLLLFLAFFIAFIIAVFPQGWQGHLYRSGLSLLFFSALMTINKHRRAFLGPVLFAIAIQWIASVFDLNFLEMTSKLLNFLFFLYMTVYFIREIVIAGKVTSRVILESIIGYLMLGIVFSIFVGFLVQVDAAMFSFPDVPGGINYSHFNEHLYFGFVTLSTLGYGDIVPLLPISRSLSILISVSGQLYLAIIIALLVGKYASKKEPPPATPPV